MENSFFLSRQKEVQDLQSQCSKLQKVFQRSESALRETLASQELAMEAGRKEVREGRGWEEGRLGGGIEVGRYIDFTRVHYQYCSLA